MRFVRADHWLISGDCRSKRRNSDFEVSLSFCQAVGYLFRYFVQHSQAVAAEYSCLFLHSWLNDSISCVSIWTARCSEMRPVKIHNGLLHVAATFFDCPTVLAHTHTHQVGSYVWCFCVIILRNMMLPQWTHCGVLFGNLAKVGVCLHSKAAQLACLIDSHCCCAHSCNDSGRFNKPTNCPDTFNVRRIVCINFV